MSSALAAQPNILLIVVDDLDHSDISAYGGNIPTPNIDRIAASGVKFARGYATASLCSPSRAGLITGRYQNRFGLEYNVSSIQRAREDNLGLPTTEITMADHMASAGYATGMVGKWHLGPNAPFHPTARGFDEFFGFMGGSNMYIDPDDPTAITSGNSERIRALRVEDPILNGHEEVTVTDYLSDVLTDKAINFIDRHQDEPFFLLLSYSAPHYPLQAKLEDYDRFPEITDERERIYAGMLANMDDGVGRVLDKLRFNGLLRDTLVAFVSDNGCAWYLNVCTDAELRGGKLFLLEGGVRAPYLLLWPDRLPGGTEFSHQVSTMDLLPTFLAAAGQPIPENLDGVDLLPHITGDPLPDPPHSELFWQIGTNGAVTANNGEKLWVWDGDPDAKWFFDLIADPGEINNLYQPGMEEVQRLAQEGLAWREEMIPAAWPPKGSEPVTVDGVEITLEH